MNDFAFPPDIAQILSGLGQRIPVGLQNGTRTLSNGETVGPSDPRYYSGAIASSAMQTPWQRLQAYQQLPPGSSVGGNSGAFMSPGPQDFGGPDAGVAYMPPPDLSTLQANHAAAIQASQEQADAVQKAQDRLAQIQAQAAQADAAEKWHALQLTQARAAPPPQSPSAPRTPVYLPQPVSGGLLGDGNPPGGNMGSTPVDFSGTNLGTAYMPGGGSAAPLYDWQRPGSTMRLPDSMAPTTLSFQQQGFAGVSGQPAAAPAQAAAANPVARGPGNTIGAISTPTNTDQASPMLYDWQRGGFGRLPDSMAPTTQSFQQQGFMGVGTQPPITQPRVMDNGPGFVPGVGTQPPRLMDGPGSGFVPGLGA